MEFIIIWGIFAIVAGVIASNKKRSVFGWALLSIVLTPLVILILLALPPVKREEMVMVGGHWERRRWVPATKKCPQCAEDVKYEAKVCRFCGHKFEAPSVPPSPTKSEDPSAAVPNRGSSTNQIAHDQRWPINGIIAGIAVTVVAGFVIYAGVQGALQKSADRSPPPQPQAQPQPDSSNSIAPAAASSTTATNSTPSTQNVANDRLLALPKSQQVVMLGKIVPEGCKGVSAFYQGIGKSGIENGKAFWSLRCSNGRTYEVEIEPDATGSTSILECSVLKAVKGGECFKKFPD